MYGADRPQLPWGTSPSRRRSTQVGGEEERYSTGGMNYYGMDGSESSTSGGFTPVSRGIGHLRSASMGYQATTGEGDSDGPEKSYKDRVNQIVQNFFWKAAMCIIQQRMQVVPLLSPRTGELKPNKWFNIELDEMESFRDELRPWRLGDAFDPRPPALIIETYLDTGDLTPTQALVIIDSNDKRWNVTETLENVTNRAGLNVGLRRGERGAAGSQQIVLERWRIELTPPFDLAQSPELPVVYKKCIVLFRALYSYLGMTPTWKFRRRLTKLKLHSASLKIGCRVLSGDEFAKSARRFDGLKMPLYPGDEQVTEDFAFGKVESPAGSFTITTSHRRNCDFRVDDSESLLSSHFINLDEHRPSSHLRTSSQPSTLASARGMEPGSLPPRPEYVHGGFQQTISASPISHLRAAEMGRTASGSSSIDRPSSGLRPIPGAKASRGPTDIRPVSRRDSLSFQPFKSPSLSASPATSDQVFHGSSLGRISTPGAPTHRARPSIGGASPSSYKSAQSTVTPSEGTVTHTSQTPIPIASASPAPQPMTRIASSFGSRRPRISSAASVTRADEDNSSGQASYSSSMAAPGSGLYTTAEASSYEDDMQIRDFMSLLADGQKKSLKSFGGGGEGNGGGGGESSKSVVSNPLARFQKMRDSQSALVDSISSSLLLQPSSSSSRNLSSVPGMIPSTSFSQSSSLGKPLSPQTPHTPAVPSRLSAGLTAQYSQQDSSQRQHQYSRVRSPPAVSNTRQSPEGGAATTSPLDIPTSPRFIGGPRRANSMSQQQQSSIEYENPPAAAAVSLGSVDQAPLSLSRLQDLKNASQSALPGREAAEPPPPPSSDGAGWVHRVARGGSATSSATSSHRASRFSTGSGRGSTNASVLGRRTPSWSRTGGSGGPEDDDLLFAMSDMQAGGGGGGSGGGGSSRRSLEQQQDKRGGRGGGWLA